MRLALAQTSSSLGGVAKNLEKHVSLVRKAREEKCNVILFPELSLTGYTLKDLAYHMPEPCRKALAELSEECRGIYAVAGFVEEGRRGILYNSAAVLHEGKVISVSRKLFLPTYGLFEEKRYFKEGETDRISAVESKAGTFGVCICEDAWHFQPPAILSSLGADVILCPAASPARGFQAAADGLLGIQRSWLSLGAAHAIINNVFFACANNAGSQDAEGFYGGSFVASPSGSIIASAGVDAEDFVVADLNLDEVRTSRIFSSFRDARPELNEFLWKASKK